MMIDKKIARKKRHWRIRKKIAGTEQRPRLALFVSNKNFYAQAIDDDKQITLLAYSSLNLSPQGGNNKAIVKQVATKFAQLALAKKFTQLVLDRGGFLFHGKLKEFVTVLKAKGLKI